MAQIERKKEKAATFSALSTAPSNGPGLEEASDTHMAHVFACPWMAGQCLSVSLDRPKPFQSPFSQP